MRRSLLLSLSGMLLAALTVWTLGMVAWSLWRDSPPADAGLPTLAQGEETVQVAEVLAANRARLASGQEIRLAALRVPLPGEPFAEEGKQATRALAEGQSVRLVGPPDAAYLYLPDGQLLQAMLLSGGYARLDPAAPPDATLPQLQSAEQQARDANLGVWRGVAVATLAATEEPILCDPSLVPGGDTIGPDEAAAHIGETRNVVFLPPRATTSNGAVTLLVGLGDSAAFGVTIPAGLASTIDAPALRYLNHCLVTTGRIERDVEGAPRILLRSFDQLLILR